MKIVDFLTKKGMELDDRVDDRGMPVVLGRGEEADFKVPYKSEKLGGTEFFGGVSRMHAKISWAPSPETGQEAYLLEDLGSMNGTFYNRRKLEPGERVVLKPGDKILLGLYPIDIVK